MRVAVLLTLLVSAAVADPVTTAATRLRFTKGSPGNAVRSTGFDVDLPLGLTVAGSAVLNLGGTGTYAWNNDLRATFDTSGTTAFIKLLATGVSSSAAQGAGFDVTSKITAGGVTINGPGIDLGVATSSTGTGKLGTSHSDSDDITAGPSFGIPFIAEGSFGASLTLTQKTFWDSLDVDYALTRRGGGGFFTGSFNTTGLSGLTFNGLAPGTYDFSLTGFDLNARNQVRITPGLTASYTLFGVEGGGTIPLFDAVNTTKPISLSRNLFLGLDPFRDWFSFTIEAPQPPPGSAPEPATWVMLLFGAAFAIRRATV